MEPKQLYLKAMEAILKAESIVGMHLIGSGQVGRHATPVGAVAEAIGMHRNNVRRHNLHKIRNEAAWIAMYSQIVPRTGEKTLQRVKKPSAREAAILDAANRLSELRRKYGAL